MQEGQTCPATAIEKCRGRQQKYPPLLFILCVMQGASFRRSIAFTQHRANAAMVSPKAHNLVKTKLANMKTERDVARSELYATNSLKSTSTQLQKDLVSMQKERDAAKSDGETKQKIINELRAEVKTAKDALKTARHALTATEKRQASPPGNTQQGSAFQMPTQHGQPAQHDVFLQYFLAQNQAAQSAAELAAKRTAELAELQHQVQMHNMRQQMQPK